MEPKLFLEAGRVQVPHGSEGALDGSHFHDGNYPTCIQSLFEGFFGWFLRIRDVTDRRRVFKRRKM